MDFETGSLSGAINEFAAGSAKAAPTTDFGSAALNYLPLFPSQVIGVVGQFLENFGL